MTEQSIFNYGFELLEKRYPKESLHADIKALYLQHFMENLTAPEFLEAVKHAVLNSRFMPTAGELVDYVKGGKESKSVQEWQIVLAASAKANPEEETAYLSSRARVALQAIGGLRAVGVADQHERQRMEKSFITVYCQCSSKDSKSLPQSSSSPIQDVQQAPLEAVPMPEHVRQKMEALKGKFAMTGKGGDS